MGNKLIYLLVIIAVLQTAQGGKILKKLTKELKKVLGGSKFEDYVKNNLVEVAENSDKIYHNADNITSNSYKVHHLADQVDNATRCTAVNWDYECCTSANPCGLDQGDCDSDDECSGDLKCGTDNCLNFGAGNNADCCIAVIPGHNVVWFEAYRTSVQYVSGSETITYEGLEGSVGSGMNAATGIFTAPEDGVYEFHVQVYKWNPNGNQSIKLYSNSKVLSSVRDEDGDKKTSLFMTAIADLVAGDQVWVTADINVYGDSIYRYSKFTGVKI